MVGLSFRFWVVDGGIPNPHPYPHWAVGGPIFFFCNFNFTFHFFNFPPTDSPRLIFKKEKKCLLVITSNNEFKSIHIQGKKEGKIRPSSCSETWKRPLLLLLLLFQCFISGKSYLDKVYFWSSRFGKMWVWKINHQQKAKQSKPISTCLLLNISKTFFFFFCISFFAQLLLLCS